MVVVGLAASLQPYIPLAFFIAANKYKSQVTISITVEFKAFNRFVASLYMNTASGMGEEIGERERERAGKEVAQMNTSADNCINISMPTPDYENDSHYV